MRSFAYAFNGVISLIKNEPNARIHLVALILVLALGTWLSIDLAEWAMVIFAAGLVFMAELFNTAIEKLADVAHPQWDKKIEIIKDYAAAAVLVSAIVAAVAGAMVFLPPLVQLIWPG